jgi:YVTN family beta-propeller protein
MISSSKTLLLVFLAAIGVMLAAGCNDTLRQFIVPVPQPGGDPRALGNAVVLSTNPSGNGSTTHIDVSGDTLAGIVTVGPNPVFLGKAGGSVFVINGDGTISSYIALASLNATVRIATPAPSTSGLVAGGTSSSGNFFTANNGSNNVSVISGGTAAVTQIVPPVGSPPVGLAPVAIAGNSANSKMYVINNGSNDVTVVSTTDNTVIKSSIPVGAKPIWGVMSADGVDVFVVNQGDGTLAHPGSVSVIDTTLDQVIPCTPGPSCDPVTHAISVGLSPATSSPNFAFYDPNRQRVYVSNTGENTISVIKADGINLGVTPQITPQLLANITPLSGTPVSVAALNDGSKVYAALGNCPAGTNHTNLLANLASCNGTMVSVIDAVGLRETGTITVGSGAVSVDVASDAARAYAVAAHAGTVTDIRVATNSVITFPAPQQNLSCSNPASCPANVPQTPFMVRTFP